MGTLTGLLFLIAALATHGLAQYLNKTFHNPILPGWNSDPSCTFIHEWDDTFFCTTSSFMSVPGAPIYASKDLVNWRLVSHAFTREEQLPELATNPTQLGGIWASTLRFNEGTLYLITAYLSWADDNPRGGQTISKIKIFRTTDPYNDATWSNALEIENHANMIDPDLFWDAGKAYMLQAEDYLSEIDINTGKATEAVKVWNGTGGFSPEGPHFYHKDGYYYIMQAEGGTESNHSEVIARSKSIAGPYTALKSNPILTNRATNQYFQDVGHADLFQDASGNWWGVALAVRGGLSDIVPMNRETVLFEARWDKGEWPILEPVRGNMSGRLPPRNRDIAGDGHWVDDPDIVDFPHGSSVPQHFIHWRRRDDTLFTISPKSHPNSLQISPSNINLTGFTGYDVAKNSLAFIARKQSATLFNYTVDLSFNPKVREEEAGISLFLNQFQHMDLGIVNLPRSGAKGLLPHIRFRVEASGKPNTKVPETVILPVPKDWHPQPIRLYVSAISDTQYVFGVSPANRPDEYMRITSVSGEIVTGGLSPFTGSLLGAYATNNGGGGRTAAFFSRWRYLPVAQQIDYDTYV